MFFVVENWPILPPSPLSEKFNFSPFFLKPSLSILAMDFLEYWLMDFHYSKDSASSESKRKTCKQFCSHTRLIDFLKNIFVKRIALQTACVSKIGSQNWPFWHGNWQIRVADVGTISTDRTQTNFWEQYKLISWHIN